MSRGREKDKNLSPRQDSNLQFSAHRLDAVTTERRETRGELVK